jgi:hypothetical protein
VPLRVVAPGLARESGKHEPMSHRDPHVLTTKEQVRSIIGEVPRHGHEVPMASAVASLSLGGSCRVGTWHPVP